MPTRGLGREGVIRTSMVVGLERLVDERRDRTLPGVGMVERGGRLVPTAFTLDARHLELGILIMLGSPTGFEIEAPHYVLHPTNP